MKRQVSLARRFVLIMVLLQGILVIGVSAANSNRQRVLTFNISHEFVIDALEWEATPISCLAGDNLSGELRLTNDGDLFIGDQTKYDNWLLGGIDFLILDETNYELWLDDLPSSPLYERTSVIELTWSVEIPSGGIWYIVYFNDSIFMKQVQGNIQHISQRGFTYTLVIASLVCTSALLILLYVVRKKR